MSGLLVLAILSIHLTFGVYGFIYFLKGMASAQTWTQSVRFGIYSALTFALSTSLYLSLLVFFYSGAHFGDFALLIKVGLGLPAILFAIAFFAIPFLFGKSENKYQIAKAGIGLAYPASSLFVLAYQQYFLGVIAT
jgi:hypothetical protein